MSIIEHIFRVIAPHYCLGCGAEGQLLCASCAGRLSQPHLSSVLPPLVSVHAATEYTDLSKKLVHHLKFERASAAADDIAALMAARLTFPGGSVITFVPTAPARVRVRGYDQAQRIAKLLGRRTGLPVIPLLTRKSGVRQVGQGRAQRLQQMTDAFYVPRPQHVQGRRIVLVDDVITTGASLQSAARALQKAGAKEIHARTFAATLQP
jgi:ComF family protein